MHPRSSLVLIGLCAACALGGENADPADLTKSNESSSSTLPRRIDPVVEQADRLLAGAQDAMGAARAWMKSNISDARFAKSKQDAEAAVNSAWERALAQAEAELARSLGLWVYHPADTAAQPPLEPRWHRPDQAESMPSNVVVLIHGLDDAGELWDDAAQALSSAGHTPIAFNYRNDQGISRSADDLASALRALRAQGVERVSIVGHSMGGLLARDILTRPDYTRPDAGLPRVDRLIMLGPPNLGAPLAPLRSVMEVRDQFARWLRSDGSSTSAMLGFLVDGRGEAGADLTPGSPFLNELNARPPIRDIPNTIVVGTLGEDCRSGIADALDTDFARRTLGERAVAWRTALDTAAQTLGDGCVPASSTALPGVSDVVTVEADHRSMISRVDALEATREFFGKKRTPPPAIPIILERIATPAR